MTIEAVLQQVVHNHGFLSPADVRSVAESDRLRLLLVRCGNCRFLCPAQDVDHILAIIQKEGSDYVRDVSLPAGDSAHNRNYKPATDPYLEAHWRKVDERVGHDQKQPTNYHGMPAGLTTADAIQRSKPRPGGTGLPLTPNHPIPDPRFHFDEADCGGAFDGFTVTSDADPGL